MNGSRPLPCACLEATLAFTIEGPITCKVSVNQIETKYENIARAIYFRIWPYTTIWTYSAFNILPRIFFVRSTYFQYEGYFLTASLFFSLKRTNFSISYRHIWSQKFHLSNKLLIIWSSFIIFLSLLFNP